MPLFTIIQIECLNTQLPNQPDELQCRLLADEQEIAHFTRSINTGERWEISEPVFYINSVAVQLWQDATPKPYFIGQTDVSPNDTPTPAGFTDELTNGAARYRLFYQLTPYTTNSLPLTANFTPEITEAAGIRPANRALTPKSAPTTQPLIYQSSFLPTVNGFAFANYFAVKLPFFSAANTTYGLCGGMVKAAADFFVHNLPLPSANVIPQINTPLYRYLFKRQLQSFGAVYHLLGKFFAWWMFKSDTQVQVLCLAEWNNIKVQLQQKRIVQLGMVYVNFKQGKLWENHQVLAYGYEQVSNETAHIFIYDPNFPRRNNVFIKAQQVAFTIGNTPTSLLICEQHVPNWIVKPVRGFFEMPLTPQKPPMLV
ncbi:MAG TPA: hypothetical protein PK239_07465 [Chitinophagales bacterium]|nr:hypothetical protein [Chitinophagales bacterium]